MISPATNVMQHALCPRADFSVANPPAISVDATSADVAVAEGHKDGTHPV